MDTTELCTLCQQIMGDNLPVKRLWCGHSFCGVCIEDYHYRRHSPRQLICPKCGAEMFLPDCRIDSLPIDYDYEENVEYEYNDDEADEDAVDRQRIRKPDSDSATATVDQRVDVEEDLSTQATMPVGDFVSSECKFDADLRTVPSCSLLGED